MSAVAQSVSTLTNTIQKSSFATVEEKVAGFKAIGLALKVANYILKDQHMG